MHPVNIWNREQCTASLTLWFSSTIWRKVCPEDGVVDVTTAIEPQCCLKGYLRCYITFRRKLLMMTRANLQV